MFETVFNEVSWDCHGSRPFTPLQAYGESVGPWFDSGYTTLLEDLHGRGMLENTLVVAMGEFGRTPKLNPAGGRDHWPQCWSIVFAGGGVRGGQVIGASDKIGGTPTERPVSPAEVAATIYHATGVPLDHQLSGPNGESIRVIDAEVKPILELF
jgi:arylsulfatase A-like enzyme